MTRSFWSEGSLNMETPREFGNGRRATSRAAVALRAGFLILAGLMAIVWAEELPPLCDDPDTPGCICVPPAEVSCAPGYFYTSCGCAHDCVPPAEESCGDG